MPANAPASNALNGDGKSGSYSKNLTIGGTLGIAKLATASNGVALGAVATSGAACSPNGTIAQDNSNSLYICQSGIWKNVGGSGLGINQNWVNLTGARSIGSTYTNATDKPIALNISVYCEGSHWGAVYLYVNGNFVGGAGVGNSSAPFPTIFAVVPDQQSYWTTWSGGGCWLNSWSELR